MLVWMENTSNSVSFIEEPSSKSEIIRLSSVSSETNINAFIPSALAKKNSNNNNK